jgi:YVTN family beta-propeller protein
MNAQKLTRYNFAVLLAVLIGFSSCKKDHVEPAEEVFQFGNGMLILNEGGFNANNASLSYYDYDKTTLTADIFKTVNQRDLGDVGNDLKVYGSKMYIVMNASGTLEVLNAKTAKSIKQISFKNGEINRQPRSIVFHKNKAFISSFDGKVAVLDTTSLVIEKFIEVGRNPDQMAIANGKLYVANSGGLSFPNYDNSVSVIDLNTLEEIKKITVVMNPGKVAADQYGDVYVLSIGNYGDVLPALNIINSTTDQVTSTISDFKGSNITIAGDMAYFTTHTGVMVFDVKTETMVKDEFVADGTSIGIPHNVVINEARDEVFITDAVDYAGSKGKIHCFDKAGNKKYTLTSGLFPGHIVFVNK